MDTFRSIVFVLTTVFTILLITGLVRPWMVIGWMETQNRLAVIRFYGSLILVMIVLRILLSQF